MRRPLLTILAVLLILSLLCIAAIAGWLGYTPQRPWLHVTTLGNFTLDPVNGRVQDIPWFIRRLDGHRVRLRGEMWLASPAPTGITQFTLAPHLRSFNPHPPLVQQFVRVSMSGDRTAPFALSDVDVDGTLYIRFQRQDNQIMSVFQLVADRVTPASLGGPAPASQDDPWVTWCAWILIGFAFLAPGVMAFRHQRRRHRLLYGFCVRCGHDLTGNVSGICPECGAPIPASSASRSGTAAVAPSLNRRQSL